MFRHVVMFRWSSDIDDAQVEAVSAALDGLVDVIPQIRGYRHGPDAGVNEGNFDYVVVGDFDSVDDYLVYRDAPAHTDMVRELIAPHVTERAAVQYEFEV